MKPMFRSIMWGVAFCTVCVCSDLEAQQLLWDNDLGPPWGPCTGRGVSPPAFPNVRVVDDFRVGDRGWIITSLVASLMENSGWIASGSSTVYVYRDINGRPGDDALFLDQIGPNDRVFTGQHRGAGPMFWHTVQVQMPIPTGTWWIGLRDGMAQGEGSAFWTTNPDGGPNESSTGFFSRDSGQSWNAERLCWHHAFEIHGFAIGEQTPGFIREIEPVHFSGEPVGGVEEVRGSDDEYYELTADLFSQVSRAHLASVILRATLPVFPLDGLGLRVESNSTHTTVRQELAIFDFDADQWLVVDDRPLPTDGDMIVTLESFDQPDRFINNDDGQVQVRLGAYSPGTTLTKHTVKIDQLTLLVTYAPM